jgi:hypothetical protein
MASTAEGMGQRDQRYAKHFSEFTTRLQSISDLEDLAQGAHLCLSRSMISTVTQPGTAC